MQVDTFLHPDLAFDLKTVARRAAHSCTLQLAVYGSASALIYVIAFLRPYGLLEWWMTSNRTIAKFSNFEWTAGAGYVLAMAGLFALYLLALRSAKWEVNRRVLAVIIVSGLVFNGLLLFLYPVDSADVFDNIIRGRMTALYGLNPFMQTPDVVRTDPFFVYSAWRFFPSAYGPLWEWLAGSVARVAGNDIVANVLAFKLLSVAAYIGTCLLVILMLQQFAPDRVAYGAVFVLWNPLALYATAGNGHNDAVMLFCAVLGFYLTLRKHFTLALVSLTAGALVKFIPVLFMPILLLAALKALPDSKARLRFLIVTSIACGALAWVAYARFAHNGALVDLDWRWNLYTTSLSTWAWYALQNLVVPRFAALLVSRAGYILLGAWVLREIRLLWRLPHRDNPRQIHAYVRAALSILLFYLVVTATWFQTWYVAWLVPLAALLPGGFLPRTVLIFCAAALWKMPLFDFFLAHNALPVQSEWGREIWLTPGVLAAPWLYFGLGYLKRERKQTQT